MDSRLRLKFFSFFKVVFFLAICFAVSLAVVFPLWAFASNAPLAYSLAVLVVALALGLWKAANWAKKVGLKKTIFVLLKALAVMAGVFGCFYFLFNFNRLLSAASLVLAIVLFKLIDFFSKRN